MTDHTVAALLGRVLARKGKASPFLAFEHLMGPVAAARNEGVNPIADPASPGHYRSGLGLGLLIRRRSTIIPPDNSPASAAQHRPVVVAAVRTRKGKRRQLTVRLPLDQFRRFKDLAGRSGGTYQDILASATHAYLEQAPKKSVIARRPFVV